MIIQCDFDGTILTNNMSVLLRQRFAPPIWRDMETDFENGIISVERSNILQYSLVTTAKKDLQSFVHDNISLRNGFQSFISFCNSSSISVVIVSSGLDFYIQTILKAIGLENIELYCAHTTINGNGIQVGYRDPEGYPVEEDFKNSYARWLKERDAELIYLGDGLSDIEAAKQAVHVFATGRLPGLLDERAYSYYTFSDFFDVIGQLKKL
jgi:2-hydroxy-3-keto-5-methylthiopentenyl-1-phosphate phosphatase